MSSWGFPISRNSVGVTEAEFENLKGIVLSIRRDLNLHIENIEGIDGIEGQLANLEAFCGILTVPTVNGYANVSSAITTFHSDISSAESDISALQSFRGNVDAIIGSYPTYIGVSEFTDIVSALEVLDSSFTTMSGTTLPAIQTDVSELQIFCGDLTVPVDAYYANVAEVIDAVHVHDDSITSLTSSYGTLAANYDTLNGTVIEHEERISEIEMPLAFAIIKLNAYAPSLSGFRMLSGTNFIAGNNVDVNTAPYIHVSISGYYDVSITNYYDGPDTASQKLSIAIYRPDTLEYIAFDSFDKGTGTQPIRTCFRKILYLDSAYEYTVYATTWAYTTMSSLSNELKSTYSLNLLGQQPDTVLCSMSIASSVSTATSWSALNLAALNFESTDIFHGTSSGTLKIKKSGYYRVSTNVSYTSAASWSNSRFYTGILNGTDSLYYCQCIEPVLSDSGTYDCQNSEIMYLEAGTELSLCTKAPTASGTIENAYLDIQLLNAGVAAKSDFISCYDTGTVAHSSGWQVLDLNATEFPYAYIGLESSAIVIKRGGYYLVNGLAYFGTDTVDAASTLGLAISKNGTRVIQNLRRMNIDDSHNCGVFGLLKLVEGDTLTIEAYCTESGTVSSATASEQFYTYLQAYCLSLDVYKDTATIESDLATAMTDIVNLESNVAIVQTDLSTVISDVAAIEIVFDPLVIVVDDWYRYSASIRSSSDQSFTAGYTTITMDTVVYDGCADYYTDMADTTNSRVYCRKTGVYQVSCHWNQSVSTSHSLKATNAFTVNSTRTYYVFEQSESSFYHGGSFVRHIALTDGDYVSMQRYHYSGSITIGTAELALKFVRAS